MTIVFIGNATHPHTGYYTLAIEASAIAVGIALVFAPWIASYTESVEAKNPALVGTGLALWGWILRLTIGISFIFLPLVITSVNPIVDNLPVAQTVIHGQSVQNFVANTPRPSRSPVRTGTSWPSSPRTRPRPPPSDRTRQRRTSRRR